MIREKPNPDGGREPLRNLFQEHCPRPAPDGGDPGALAAEIAALLNGHARHIQTLKDKHRQDLLSFRSALARIAQLVFHLERWVGETESGMAQAGLDALWKRLRILKDQLKDRLAAEQYVWIDLTGEDFVSTLEEHVRVEGVRRSSQCHREKIVETREPIVLCEGEIVLPGVVVVCVPETEGGPVP
jgi:hypothetical protein